eukprot:11242847-Heterocapsa_arctica.AAC.1
MSPPVPCARPRNPPPADRVAASRRQERGVDLAQQKLGRLRGSSSSHALVHHGDANSSSCHELDDLRELEDGRIARPALWSLDDPRLVLLTEDLAH